MALVRWLGQAVAVAQVDDGSIDTLDGTPANNTFTITINGIAVSVVGITDVSTTAAALVVAAEASTHPYFVAVTWTNPSSGNIKATAGIAGFPFTATLSVSGGGTGTITNFSNSTASSGPLDLSTVANYSTGALPGAADDFIIEEFTGDIWFGLAAIVAVLNRFQILKTFTGKIGLNSKAFATDVSSEDDTAQEYRTDYMELDADEIEIGEQTGPGSPAGSQRIKIDNQKAGASILTVFDTAGVSSEAGLPAVRFKANNASADIIVQSAPAGVGIAKDFTGETSTIGDVDMRSTSAGDKVFVGQGVTLTNFTQSGGVNVLEAAANVTLVKVTGGVLNTRGTGYLITTLTIENDGEVLCNNTGSAAVAVTTANLNQGILDGLESGATRTWTTVNQAKEAILKTDPNVVTITNLNLPTGDRFSLTTAPEN